MANVYIDEKQGQLVKGNGFIETGSTGTLTKGSFSFTFYRSDGSRQFLVGDSSQVLATTDFKSYVFVTSGLATTTNLQAVQVEKKVWFTNGSDPIFTWDESNTKQILNGTKGLPNVPRFKYIAYHQGRIFGLNTSGNTSSLDFSAPASTDSVAISPDHQLAWPVTNRLFVDNGDGDDGTGLFVFKGQLYIFKERSIHILFGTNTSNYITRKINAQVGAVSQDTIAELDGFVYFLGKDGIYKFDGGNTQRISDLIGPDIEAIRTDTTRIVEDTWDTQADFARGQFFGSTATADGFLTVRGSSINLNTINETSHTGEFVTFSSTYIPAEWGVVVPTFTVPPSYYAQVSELVLWARSRGTCTGANRLKIILKNTNNQATVEVETSISAGSPAGTFSRHTLDFQNNYFNNSSPAPYPNINGSEINTSKFEIHLTTVANTLEITPGCLVEVYRPTDTGKGTLILRPTPYTGYLSEVSTITTLTAWDNFEAEGNTNGGTINYYLRTATSAVNITTTSWTSFTPGSRISSSQTQTYVQWAASMAAVNIYSNPTNIDYVTIKHIEGAGSNTRAFATTWKNRYWLAVSTASDGNHSIIYVKAKASNPAPDAWMKFTGINIRSFTKDGADVLYGGASSLGKWYRLDYGTNYDNSPIRAYWTSPELILGSNFQDKTLFSYLIDADRETGNTLTIGTSINGGDFADTSISLNGTGRYVREYNAVNTRPFNTVRFRFENSQLDKFLGLNTFGVVYLPQRIRSTR